jgi:uncharacterized membrane protein YjjP (DUF1212 family)
MARESRSDILECALLAAHVLLENGAETYRAEDSAARICLYFGVEHPQVLALPTAAFLTLERPGEAPQTALRRVRKRTTDLTRIAEANDVSRRLVGGEMSLCDGIAALRALTRSHTGGKWKGVCVAALSSACFAVLFGGGWFDFLVAALCGLTVQWIAASFKVEDYFHFIISLLGGGLIALLAVLLTALTGLGSQNAIIAGALMPLLPGLAMTNAMRDTMRGDLVSGVARAAEALLVAVALAAGVGVVLGARVLLGA